MPDKIVNHFVMADGSTAKYSAEQLAGTVPDVDVLNEIVMYDLTRKTEWSKGVYETNGYASLSTSNFKFSRVFPAGSYTITPPATLTIRWEVYYYVSDTQGGKRLWSFSTNTRTFYAYEPFVISIGKNGGGSLSGLESDIENFSIVYHNQDSLQTKTGNIEVQTDNVYCEDVYLGENGNLVISLLSSTGGVSSDRTGIRTSILSFYNPVKIKMKNDNYITTIQEYNSNLTFNGTHKASLLQYTHGCDFVVSSDNYPIYIAIGFRNVETTTVLTNDDIVAIQNGLEIKGVSKPVQYTNISMFKTIGVTGDSWTAGTIYNEADTSVVSRTGQGWGENLARQNGVTCVNFAKGGTSVRTWYNEPSGNGGLKQLLASDAVGLYILSFGGSNDWTSSQNGGRGWEINVSDGETENPSLYYFGTIADISGYESYTDYPLTFYGYYGRIIEQIQEHAPNSRIVITTPNTYPTSVEKCAICYQATSEIANYYGIPYVDMRKDQFFVYWTNTSLLNGNHPVASTYAGMGEAMGRLLSKSIFDNFDYFRDYFGELTTVPVEWSPLTK